MLLSLNLIFDFEDLFSFCFSTFEILANVLRPVGCFKSIYYFIYFRFGLYVCVGSVLKHISFTFFLFYITRFKALEDTAMVKRVINTWSTLRLFKNIKKLVLLKLIWITETDLILNCFCFFFLSFWVNIFSQSCLPVLWLLVMIVTFASLKNLFWCHFLTELTICISQSYQVFHCF